VDERDVIGFEELGSEHVSLVGGKCANLGELTGAGFPVPPGFAVTTAAYARAGVRPQAVPAEVAERVGAAYRELAERLGASDPPVAVRSSAVAEDTSDASFAGVQDTYLWLRGVEAVLDGVRRCWASYYNPEAVAYRAEHEVADSSMSVAVQAMVDARVAGVMFTLNPLSGDPSTVAIDASYGLGVSVVSGEVTPDSFLVNKITHAIVRSEIGGKEIECVPDADLGATIMRAVPAERRVEPCLSPEEIARLVALARRVERHYGRHQDLEWAIDRRLAAPGDIFLLQSRPETVWAHKQAAAPPALGALAAVAATFSGGLAAKPPGR